MGDQSQLRADLKRLGASAVSGLVSRCFVHPMDTVRTNIMAGRGGSHASIVSVVRDILRTQGVGGLYRGFGVTATMQAPAIATFLTSYDIAKSNMVQLTGLSATSPVVHLCSGLAAEAVSAVFWVPMEVLKQRAQLREGAGASSIVALRDLVRHEGAAALLRGYGITLAVFGPYSMLYFMAYERCKQQYCRHYGVSSARELPGTAILTSAAVSGGFAAAATTPLDVVKTRLQTQGDVALEGLNQYRSTLDAVRKIAAEEGFRGLTRGLGARVFWIMPQTAITMSTFERLKKLWNIPEIE